MDTKERWDKAFAEGKDFNSLNEIFVDTELMPRLEKFLPSDSRSVLDIGCGTGDVLCKMQKRGFQVTGVDASSVAVEIARVKTGIGAERIIVGDLDKGALDQFKGPYTLITMKLVVAFVSDRSKLFADIKRLLHPRGVFLVLSPVTYSGVSYSKPITKSIAVDEECLLVDLSHVFPQVECIHKDYLDDNGILGYYLCTLG